MTQGDDREQIRRLIEDWVIWRDTGDWDRFLTLWHPEGRMMATWFQGTAAEFAGDQPLGLRARRPHPPRPRRHLGRRRGRSGDRPDANGDPPARRRRRSGLRRRVHRPVLRLPRTPRVALGVGAAPADLREGPPRPDRSGCRTSMLDANCSSASPRDTGISPTCRPGSATTSRPTCPASPGRSSTRCTGAARDGWRAARSERQPGPIRR